VHPRFRRLAVSRSEARASLGLGLDPDRSLVTVVAGSWGVGDRLEDTVALLTGAGHQVVVACGGADDLRARLEGQGLGHPVGWTDQMPALLGAADVVIENAGGLTAFETLSLGVPLVSYRPIPGHGRDNIRAMVAARVTTWPDTELELLATVAELAADTPTRTAQIAAGLAMFREDPTERILALAAERRAGTVAGFGMSLGWSG
jgi:processive 1,2-diacylglycerol beta-glucosyltransferase